MKRINMTTEKNIQPNYFDLLRQDRQSVFTMLKAQEPRPTPKLKIALISTPRSGSTMFCRALTNTELFGKPLEWMNPLNTDAFAKAFNKENVKFKEYKNFLLERTTTPNGVFSINFHIEQYLHWKKNNIDLMTFNFDLIFFLHRKDKIAQAISFARALYTDQWAADYAQKREISPDDLSCSKIFEALKNIASQEEFFLKNISDYIDADYCYENFSRKDDDFINIFKKAHIPIPDGLVFDRTMKVQRDDLSYNVYRKILNYLNINIAPSDN